MRRPLALGALAVTTAAALLAPAAQAAPDDPLHEAQWGHVQVRAEQAWLANRGEGVVVAVVDSGVDLDHPDLAGRLVPGATFLDCGASSCGDGDWQSGPEERRGSDSTHGTHVAGIVAAVADNGVGIAGVAPDARVMPIKALDDDGGSTADVARAVDHAVAQGADVVNLSLGAAPIAAVPGEVGPVLGAPDPVLDALERAQQAGVPVVAAAGNSSLPVCDYPAVLDGVLCVASNDREEVHSFFSNFGVAPDQLAVTGPGGSGVPACGEDVVSTVPIGAEPEVCDYGPGYTEMAGTSFSAPHVAGIAALLLAQGRSLDEVLTALTATARTPGGEERGSYDPVNGYGLVDAAAAVASARRAGPPAAAPSARGVDDGCPAGRVPASRAADVPAGTPARTAVDCVAWWGVALGKVDGTFRPGEPVTRGQMASFLARLVEATGGALPVPAEDPFDDDDGNLHERAISGLAAAGVVQGTGERTYGPEQRVTRGQMATFLVRTYEFRTAADLVGPQDAFDDDSESVHRENVDKAAEAGFAAGTADGGFAPTADVTRAQMALFLSRVLDLLVENGYSTTPR